jgi:predicted Zn finger-like uncharacterized protein
MLTRCPHCETDFRVTPSQLKLRQGQVRCGTCQGVFNAIDSLADEVLPPLPPTAPAPADWSDAPPVEDIAPVDTPDEAPPTEASAMATEPGEPAEPVESSLAVDPGIEPELEPAPEPDAAENDHLPPQEESAGEEAGSRRWQDGATTESAALADVVVVPDVPETAPTAESGRISVPHDAPVPAVWEVVGDTPPPRRWPWISGMVLLLVLAASQLAYHFRVELAVLAPELRPALVTGCELLDCTMPRPRKSELIGIEASDLAPAGTDRLLLTATLKNRAPFDQEYPHLELTLTDTQDKALLRRVLAPVEYLPAPQAADAGFAPRADVAVRLTLEIPGVPAVGYRLYLFYP